MFEEIMYDTKEEKPFGPFNLASKGSSSSGNVVYGSHKTIYQDLSVLKTLTKAKFPVYLVSSRVTKRKYAMKVFAHENGQPHIYFRNETRFASLQHPHVVRNLYFEGERKARFDGLPMRISYTIMEYAPHGDFYTFLKKHNRDMDEKLARTFFRQLIEGLEYLHNNEVAHMDLKLNNLLLDEDFTLKIADFDMAHYADDAIIISNGTKFYRAPEVVQGKCNNPKAADIYSAGIVLFILKTRGVFPQFESRKIAGIDFADLLYNNPSRFWIEHSKVQKSSSIDFDEDFTDLFLSMTRFNPDERTSIEEIKQSNWYNGPCYTTEELKEKMQRVLS